MLIDAERSMLLVIDLQAKLVPVLAEHEHVVANAAWLIRVAQKLGVPVAATEQYPKGLGPLVPKVRKLIPAAAIGAKNHFSAVAAQCLAALPGHDRAQVVVVGAEAHVCVMQTSLELLEDGKEVYVVADAIASRRAADRDIAVDADARRGHPRRDAGDGRLRMAGRGGNAAVQRDQPGVLQMSLSLT